MTKTRNLPDVHGDEKKEALVDLALTGQLFKCDFCGKPVYIDFCGRNSYYHTYHEDYLACGKFAKVNGSHNAD